MRRFASILGTLSIIWSAGAEGILLTFDPPREIGAIKACMNEGKLSVVIAGTAGEKELSRVVTLKADTKRIHFYVEAEAMSPVRVIALGKLPPVNSIAFTWQEEKLTSHLSAGDRAIRIDFENDGETAVLKPVETRDLPSAKALPRITITNQPPLSASLEAPEKVD